MQRFTAAALRDMIEPQRELCVSLLMPCDAPRHDVQADRLRFKNLVHEAEQRLRNWGMRRPQVRELLEAAWQLHQEPQVWSEPGSGLVLYLAPDFGHGWHFCRHWRVPLLLQEELHVADRFYIKPLLPLLQDDGRFYLLAASQKSVRLFEGSRHSIRELAPPTLPQNLRDALKIDEYADSLQFHITGTQQAGGNEPQGRRAAMFHGHGGGDADDRKRRELRQFFHRINDGLPDYFDDYRAPLVFAGVEYLFPIFRKTCRYPTLVEQPVSGSPDLLRADQLHERALAAVQPFFRRRREEAVRRWNDLAGGERASGDVREITAAARIGAVDVLFMAEGAGVPGVVDEQTGQVREAKGNGPEAGDLLEYAAYHTLMNHGAVYVVDRDEVPGGRPASAILRHPLPVTG